MTDETMTAADVDWCRREWGWLCAVHEDLKAAMYQRILATYAECERLKDATRILEGEVLRLAETAAALRAQLAAAQDDSKRLLCDADSYLSLLYSRYVRKHEVPLDVRIEVESVIGRLRKSYKSAALDAARGE